MVGSLVGVPPVVWDRRASVRSLVRATGLGTLVGLLSAGDVGGLGSPGLVVVPAVVAGAVVLVGTRRSVEVQAWRVLTAGSLVVVVTCALTPATGGAGREAGGAASGVALAVLALGVLACPVVSWAQMALMVRRRRRTLPMTSGLLDTASTVLALVALAGALLEPRLAADGGSVPADWLHLARVSGLAVVTSTSITHGFLTGWGHDVRLWKLTAAFALLTGADALHVLAALDVVAPAAATSASQAAQVAAVVLLASAARRPVGTSRTSADITWANMLASAAVVVLGLGVLVVSQARPVSTTSVVLTAVAVLLVGVEVALVFRKLLQLVEVGRLASTDELTGLANRRGLFAALHRMHQLQDVHLLLLDLDGFKAVNDTHGHPVGDALLQDTAERLLELVPPSALVARLGGDEFVVVVPGADPSHVADLAGAVRAGLGPRAVAGVEVRVGVSIGTASAPRTPAGDCHHPQHRPAGPGVRGLGPGGRRTPATPSACDDLVRRADEDMYVQKRRGRATRG